jgi:hypothetical protein
MSVEVRVMRGDVENAEAVTRAVLMRAEGDWVAVTLRSEGPVVIGRSSQAAPLVAELRARGYSVRFAFSWNEPDRYLRDQGHAHASDHPR